MDIISKTDYDNTWLRYAPAVGAASSLIANSVMKPDYSGAEAIEKITSNLQKADYKPLGNYLTYKPFDRNYYTNKLNALSSANRNAILNRGNGNTPANTAALLAADYNAQGRLGDLARQAEEYNLAQRERVSAFNRGTDQYNSQMDLQSQAMNQRNDELRFRGALAAAQLRNQEDVRRSTAIASNVKDLFDSLGYIGWEDFNRNMINTDDSKKASTSRRGNVRYKKPKRNNNYSSLN